MKLSYFVAVSLHPLSLADSVCLRCAVARPEFKVDFLGLACGVLFVNLSQRGLALVESTVVEFAVLFYLPGILGGDSPTVNIAIIHK